MKATTTYRSIAMPGWFRLISHQIVESSVRIRKELLAIEGVAAATGSAPSAPADRASPLLFLILFFFFSSMSGPGFGWFDCTSGSPRELMGLNFPSLKTTCMTGPKTYLYSSAAHYFRLIKPHINHNIVILSPKKCKTISTLTMCTAKY